MIQYLHKMCSYILHVFREVEWRLYRIKRRLRLKNRNFTILASNCNGTFMYYDMGLRYLTPTVNLSMDMDDFVKLAGNLRWYLEQEFTELEPENGYPEGLLGDIRIHFVHYRTFEEGVQKWKERKQRINWDNLFIVGTEKDSCTYETLKRFEKLPWKNKVVFTHVEYPEFSSACYIRGFEEKEELGVLTFPKKQLLKRRFLDDFDYISFLNNGYRQTQSGGDKDG